MTPAIRSELLTLDAAGQILGVSPWTVRREAERGRLAVVRVGGQIRIEPEALDAYIAARREGTYSESA